MRTNNYAVIRKVWKKQTDGSSVLITVGTKFQARSRRELYQKLVANKWASGTSTVYYLGHNGN